jgi:hypothetical protein
MRVETDTCRAEMWRIALARLIGLAAVFRLRSCAPHSTAASDGLAARYAESG